MRKDMSRGHTHTVAVVNQNPQLELQEMDTKSQPEMGVAMARAVPYHCKWLERRRLECSHQSWRRPLGAWVHHQAHAQKDQTSLGSMATCICYWLTTNVIYVSINRIPMHSWWEGCKLALLPPPSRNVGSFCWQNREEVWQGPSSSSYTRFF